MRKLAAIVFCIFVVSATAYAQGAPSAVGYAYAGDESGGTIDTLTAATGNGTGGSGVNVAVGNYIECYTNGAAPSACTDSAGNTFTALAGSTYPSAGLWSVATATVAHSSDQISCHPNTAHVGCTVLVWQNTGGVWTLDVQGVYTPTLQTGTAGTLGSTTFTTHSSVEAVSCNGQYNSSGVALTAGLIGGQSATMHVTSSGGGAGRTGIESIVTSAVLAGAGANMTFGSSVSSINLSCIGVASGTLPSPALTVNAAAGLHAISPLIYGEGGAPPGGPNSTFISSIKMPIARWGGDLASNWNWQQNSGNTGTDFYFASGGSAPPPYTLDSDITSWRRANSGIGLLVTIPISPYLALGNPTRCSYLQSLYPTVTFSAYQTIGGLNCGSGAYASGGDVLDTNLSYNYSSNSATIQSAWVAHLIATFGNCASGGVCYYQLDNEPNSWTAVHHDWAGPTLSYTTVESEGETYLTAIKAADTSGVKVLGPSDFEGYGWTLNSPTSDPACVYYIKQMAADSKPLDYLDEHYFAGDTSGSVQNDFDQVRSWWDPTYAYSQNPFGGFATQNTSLGLSNNMELIPRMQSYITNFNPSVSGFTISEWEVNHTNASGSALNGQFPQITDATSGCSGSSPIDALVVTDALGVFGYYNLQLAALFDYVCPNDAEGFAYKLYRNYDGAGSQFGSTSITSTSSDPSKLSVYGSLQNSNGQTIMTVIVVNKEATSYTTTLALQGYTATSPASAYTYSNANPTAIQAAPNSVSVTGGNSVSYTFPAYSATEFVFTPSGTGTTAVVPPTNVLATVVQ